MQKIVLAVLVPNDATREQIGEHLRAAADEAAGRIAQVEHTADLHARAVRDESDRWAAKLTYVSLLD